MRVGKIITTKYQHTTRFTARIGRGRRHRKKKKLPVAAARSTYAACSGAPCARVTHTLWVCLLRQITVQDGTGAIRIASHSHGCSPYRKDPLSGGLCASKDSVVGYVCTSNCCSHVLVANNLGFWEFTEALLFRRSTLASVTASRRRTSDSDTARTARRTEVTGRPTPLGPTTSTQIKNATCTRLAPPTTRFTTSRPSFSFPQPNPRLHRTKPI